MERVVVTGVGLVTALGIGTDATWKALLAGRSAVGPIRGFDASSLETRVAAEIADFDPADFITNRRTLRMTTQSDRLALAATSLALDDAGIDRATVASERTALYLAGNKDVSDPSHLMEAALSARDPDGTVDMQRFGTAAQNTVYPLFFVEGLPGSSVFYVSESFGMTGPGAYFAGTAEAGMVAIDSAFRAIRHGEADLALAGAADDAASWWNLSKLDALGVLTDRNDLGAEACKPFDRDRSGAVLGDGAAVLVLESLSAATARKARIYAEVTGFGNTFEADGQGRPDPRGRGVSTAVRVALRTAATSSGSIGYVAAHGSATRLGDPSEAHGLRHALDGAAETVAASSVKAATGHLGAAAGALNAAVGVLAVRDQIVPPTLNLTHADPECDLDWIPNEARRRELTDALAIGRGAEGQTAVLALRIVT